MLGWGVVVGLGGWFFDLDKVLVWVEGEFIVVLKIDLYFI